MRNILGYIVFLILFLFSHTTYGHHAFTAEFDANAPINITGKVVKVEWINPHAWVHVEVEEDSKATTADLPPRLRSVYGTTQSEQLW